MSKPILDEQKAREIESLASQMNQPVYDLLPPWTDDEYILISTIWKIFKQNPGTNGKKIALDTLRRYSVSILPIEANKVPDTKSEKSDE